MGLLFAMLHVTSNPADAQSVVQISTQDYVLTDTTGTIDVVLALTPGDTAVAAIEFELVYDPSVIRPVLITDANEGTLNTPACTGVPPGAAACGPPNPTDRFNGNAFRITGGWANPSDVLVVPFVGQGASGSSPLTIEISVVNGITSETLPSTAINGSVTVGPPTSTPTPTNIPTSTPTPTVTATPVPSTADVSITKSVSDMGPVPVGTQLTYLVDGRNDGPTAATDVVMTDTLPVGLSFVSPPAAAGWSCETAGQLATCTKGTDLASSESFLFSYVVSVDAGATLGATLTNMVTVGASTADSNPGNNSADASVEIQGEPTATPTSTNIPTATPTPVEEPTATPTPIAEPTATPTLIADPVATATTSATPVAEPTATATVSAATATPSATSTSASQANPALAYPGPFAQAPVRGSGSSALAAPDVSVATVEPDASSTTNAGSGAPSATNAGSGDTNGTAPLAATGSEAPLLATLSVLLLTIGGVLMVVSRREDERR